MKRLLLLSICLLLIACSASAQVISITAPEGKAIKDITIGMDEGTTGTVTFNFNDDTVMTGSWSYTTKVSAGGFSLVRDGNVVVNGQTATTTFVSPGRFYIKFLQTKGMLNASDNTLRGSYGQIKGWYYNYVETTTPASPIIGISISSPQLIEYDIEYEELNQANQNVAGNFLESINQIMGLVASVFFAAYDFVVELTYWLRYFFIDNITMVVALFLAVPMAFAAKNSRGNPEKFLRQYFKTLRGFFSFVLDLWRMLLESIGTIRGWFRI